MSVTKALPPLRLADLFVGRRFGPDSFIVTPSIVELYMAITGDRHPAYHDRKEARRLGHAAPVVPFGLVAVLARRAYLGSYRMLPGGVMAGQDITFGTPGVVGDTLSLSAEITRIDVTEIRRAVELRCETRTGDGHLLARVTIDARWPEDPE